MTRTRALYERNGELARFVPKSEFDPGGVTWVPQPSASRVPPLLIVLVLLLAILASAIGIVRHHSEQPAAQSLQLNSPGPRAPALAGVVVSGEAR